MAALVTFLSFLNPYLIQIQMTCKVSRNTKKWMSQEVSKNWLGSVGYNPNTPHLKVGYNPLILTIDPNFRDPGHQEIRFWLLVPRLAWMAFVLWRAASWIRQAVALNILGLGGGDRRFGPCGKVCVEKNMFFFGVLKVDTRFLGKFVLKNDGVFWC